MMIKIVTPKTLSPNKLPADIILAVKMINEIYPVVGNKIEKLWGSAALQRYFNSIIIDDRGDRNGFPIYIGTVLLRMHSLHDRLVSENYRNSWVQATTYF